MKTCFLFILGLVTLTLSVPVDEKDQKFDVADKEFLRKYKLILQLFNYINQPSYYPEIEEIAKSFDVKKNEANYEKPEAVERFLRNYNAGFLPRGAIFSIFYKEHLREAKSLYYLFYYAKDFETFYQTACWARQNLNEGLFLYTFSVALIQREDCRGFTLPPIYEIYPYYFFNTEVIQKAYKYKQQFYADELKEKSEDGFEGYTINSNYSGYYLNLHPEQSMSYYLEDVGMNSYYYYFNLYYPFWLSSQKSDTDKSHEFSYRRGEIFYYNAKYLLSRYYMERLANKFGQIRDFDWDVPFETGYYPSLRYSNGLEFPSRPNFANLREYFFNYGQKTCPMTRDYQFSYTYVQDYFRRIRDVIDKGVVYSIMKDGKPLKIINDEGIQVLGNIIESNGDSPNPRYFGPLLTYARHLLGYSFQPKNKYQLAPSALEHFETSLRDPAFYQLFKKIFYLFERYKQYLQPYGREDLYFPGASIKNVEFDRLTTFYDYFYSDLSNAVYVTPQEARNCSFRLRAKQYRLNQKPFTYRMYIDSDKTYQVSVRAYIGPKYDEFGREFDFYEYRDNFVHFDYFQYNLTAGENVIERSYEQLFGYCNDRTSYRELYEAVLSAEAGKTEFRIQPDYPCLPRRFALPRGSVGGTPYKFYFIVSPYKANRARSFYNESNNKYLVYKMDNYPMGYPFDRRIYNSEFYRVPNAFFYETQVYFDDSITKYRPF